MTLEPQQQKEDAGSYLLVDSLVDSYKDVPGRCTVVFRVLRTPMMLLPAHQALFPVD